MTCPDQDNADERVLILAPTGRDASMTEKYLEEAGVGVEPCARIEELCERMLASAGAALISEEALSPEALQCLVEALGQQPPWSDFPLVILTTGAGTTPASSRYFSVMEASRPVGARMSTRSSALSGSGQVNRPPSTTRRPRRRRSELP